MALIGEIRQRSWILIVLIGLGMGGFLLMDMIGNNGSSIFGSRNTVGEIAGKDISITDFQLKQEELYGQTAADPFSVREGTWQFYVRETIIQKEAEALGLDVSDDELDELLYGPNPQTISPVIRQQLGDPQTGQIDMERLASIRQAVKGGQLSEPEMDSWNIIIEQVKLDRLESKINIIAAAAIYTPSWMAEMDYNATNQKADFRFVSIPYASIEEEIEVTDSELKAYLEENNGKFTSKEETRKFSYVLFDVEPTQEDSAAIAKTLTEQIEDWTNTEDDSLFVVNSNGGIYNKTYDAKEDLAPQVADTLAKISKGTIIGPYIDGSKYKIAKLLDKKVIPDSVNVRHILRNINANDPNAYATAQTERALLDSLIGVLESGAASFDSLAARYSQDPGSKDKGGVYEAVPPGQMVPQFNDYIFYEGEVGEYKIVGTQFGLHLIEVTRKYTTSNTTGYQVAYIQESIIPSQETEKEVLRVASKFAASLKNLEDLDAKAKENGFEVKTTTIGAKRNDFRLLGVGNGQAARDIIKWGYDAETGDASREVYTFENAGEDLFIDKYAVVGLKSVAPAGLVSLEDDAARLDAETAVINRKKAEMIKKKIKDGQSLDAIASANNSQIQTASQVSFNTTNVPGMGNEPKVVGTVFSASTKTNEVSAPIEGNTAVYVIEVTFKPEPTVPTDLPAAKQQAAAPLKGQVRQRLFQSLLEQHEVNDYRYRFF